MRILICGSRTFNEITAIRNYIKMLPKDAVIIEGEAPGADSIAASYARVSGLIVEPYPALWHKHGRAAGMLRNQQMLDEGKPDLVVYFHADLHRSKGTKDMVQRAEKAGIPVLGNPFC